jgi:hypothetical protein
MITLTVLYDDYVMYACIRVSVLSVRITIDILILYVHRLGVSKVYSDVRHH